MRRKYSFLLVAIPDGVELMRGVGIDSQGVSHLISLEDWVATVLDPNLGPPRRALGLVLEPSELPSGPVGLTGDPEVK